MAEAKYLTLMKWIKEQISIRQLKRGDKFYTELELASMFGISRQTVRQAVGKLEHEKILERRHGVGLFIATGVERKKGRKATIAVILTFLDNYIFPNILKGIEQVLAKEGYAMRLNFTNQSFDIEHRTLRSMLDDDVDGFIVGASKSRLYNPNMPIYKEIEERKIPLIFLDAYYPDANFHHVSMDDIMAGRLATEHLLSAGHRKIAAFFMSDVIQGHLRFEGYIKALRSAHVEYNPRNTMWYAEEDVAELFCDARRIISRIEGCTGLICFNDIHALNTVKTLCENGIRIPEDLSIVSIDDSSLATLCAVPLTSVKHPKEELGVLAAKNLIRLIKDPDFPATKLISPSLVERASVRVIVK